MAQRTAAPRYPAWFQIPDGRVETYPLLFSDYDPFDDFLIATSRRRYDVPFSQYQRVGVQVLDYPSFTTAAPFYDYIGNPQHAYSIPTGHAWRDYINGQISQGRIGSLDDLSAPNLSANAQQAINHMADNLTDISANLIVDQREESGFGDTTVAYYRIAQRIAQRIDALMASGGRTFRPIWAGGYIFFANSNPFFFQGNLSVNDHPDRRKPLRHVPFYEGDNWKNGYFDVGEQKQMYYNTFYQQGRYKFMDANSGFYPWGPNATDTIYEHLNGVAFRAHAREKMEPQYRNYRDGTFVWDQCDGSAGGFSNNIEHPTTAPAGRLLVRKRMNTQVEALRGAGFFAGVEQSFFVCWDIPNKMPIDPNWLDPDVDNLQLDRFYPDGGGGPQNWPNSYINKQQFGGNSKEARGYIDWGMLGVRQGLEVRRALGGRAVSFRFLDYKVDNGPWVLAKPVRSDVLFASEERRGVVIESIGPNGKVCISYFNAYGDHLPHMLTFRRNGQEDTMPILGTGLSYSDPF